MKRLLCLLLVTIATPAALRADEPSAEVKSIHAAVDKALPLLQKGAVGHREQRTCFACHNQALPILALTSARARGFSIDDKELQTQLKFIDDFLHKNRANYLMGRGQGGQVATAGYALWTLAMAGWTRTPATDAVAEYLLLFKKDDDYWRMTSNRPPSETSHFTATYLALRGLQAFGTPEQAERVAKRVQAAKGWLAKTPAKDTEDRVFRLWAMKRAGCDSAELEAAARELLKTQQPDGGWAQLDAMKSDAYATGSVLVALHEAGMLQANAEPYRRGVKYLLATQLEDGSWHVRSRSKPFQTYFESGFPHGKDQFISSAASGWATTALVLSLPLKGN